MNDDIDIEIDRCPVCYAPCHATEGNEDGIHPACLVNALLNENVSTRRVKPYAKGWTVRNYQGRVDRLHKHLTNAKGER